jgi:hypothetical protein
MDPASEDGRHDRHDLERRTFNGNAFANHETQVQGVYVGSAAAGAILDGGEDVSACGYLGAMPRPAATFGLQLASQQPVALTAPGLAAACGAALAQAVFRA